LMLQLMTSTDPEARASIDQMDRTNGEMFNRLLQGVAPERISYISFGLNAALTYALAGFLTGKLNLDQSLTHVEWIARALLTEGQPR
jgi:hypothetical protein